MLTNICCLYNWNVIHCNLALFGITCLTTFFLFLILFFLLLYITVTPSEPNPKHPSTPSPPRLHLLSYATRQWNLVLPQLTRFHPLFPLLGCIEYSAIVTKFFPIVDDSIMRKRLKCNSFGTVLQ